MQYTIYLISLILLVAGCQPPASQLADYAQVQENFTEAQVADLDRIIRFFQTHSCSDAFSRECWESSALQNDFTLDFSAQRALYQELNSGVTGYFWLVGWQNRADDSLAYQFYTPDGPYLQFLKALAEEKEEVKAYVEELINFGDIGPKLNQLYYRQRKEWDVSDPRIQLIIAIHELSVWDQRGRKEPL
ncbi:MAG TPA: hypothetical protein DCE41_13565 [Cytophagales bacterium]|nr:hypothetical protein [Cytophagales bacterium]HAA18230.1 hypothetical protein [Cytophagales bacterium]HAP58978.1 hypothetical protein [Cytophagales bacterium]